MCDRPAPVSALCPRVEIPPIAVVVLALACLNKNNNNNNNNQKEDEHSGVYVTVHEKIDHNAGILYFYLAPCMLSMTLSALTVQVWWL